jgi:hypothetical protein
MFLQRSLQNGRKKLEGAYTLSPPQVGQATNLGLGSGDGFTVMNTTPIQTQHCRRRHGACRLRRGA